MYPYPFVIIPILILERVVILILESVVSVVLSNRHYLTEIIGFSIEKKNELFELKKIYGMLIFPVHLRIKI